VIEFTADFSQWEKITNSILYRAAHFDEFLETKGRNILRKQSKQFWGDSQGPWGGPWNTTLIKTGALIEDLQDPMNYPVENHTLYQKTSLIYGPVHFFGLTVNNLFGKGYSHTFQERPFGGLDDEGIREFENEATDYLLLTI
jgi:hypothetical protein